MADKFILDNAPVNTMAFFDLAAIRTLAACLRRHGIDLYADVRREILPHCITYIPLSQILEAGYETDITYERPMRIEVIMGGYPCSYIVNNTLVYRDPNMSSDHVTITMAIQEALSLPMVPACDCNSGVTDCDCEKCELRDYLINLGKLTKIHIFWDDQSKTSRNYFCQLDVKEDYMYSRFQLYHGKIKFS